MSELLTIYNDAYEHEEYDEQSDYARQILEELRDFDVLRILY